MTKRLRYIDVLKVLSAFLIVVLHLSSISCHRALPDLSERLITDHFVIHQLLYVAVPVFIILTGSGLLSSDQTDLHSMKPRILKLILCIFVISTVVTLARIFILHEEVSFRSYLVLLFNGTSLSHLWYLNKLLGLYLIMPILGAFTQKASFKEVLIVDVILFTFASFIPFMAGIAGTIFKPFFPIDGIFVAYALAGFLIERADGNICRKYLILEIPGALLSLAGIFVYALLIKEPILEQHPLAVVSAIFIVLCVKGLPGSDKSSGRLLETLSRCTFVIYIIHPLFIHGFLRVTDFNPLFMLPFISLPLTALMIYAVSFVCAYLWRLITGRIFGSKKKADKDLYSEGI